MRNSAAVGVSYALPLGNGKRFLGNASGIGGTIISGWNLASIIHVQSGFPFTPQLSYNPANNGDSRNPVRPFLDPTFTGPVVTGNPNHWFNPAAFVGLPSNSGFYGNVGRDTYTGPGLATWDFSAYKDTRLNEKIDAAVPRGNFQSLEPGQFQHPKSHCLRAAAIAVHSFRTIGFGRADYQHLNFFTASPVWAEAALVAGLAAGGGRQPSILF